MAAIAYSMIAERGVDGLSLRAVARAADATTGLVSHHFADRADLVAAALQHASKVMSTRMDGATDPVIVFTAALPTDAPTIENWRFALAVRSAALVDPSLQCFDEEIRNKWNAALPLLLDGRTSLDPLDAGDFLLSVLDGVALKATVDPDNWPAARQIRQMNRALEAICN